MSGGIKNTAIYTRRKQFTKILRRKTVLIFIQTKTRKNRSLGYGIIAVNRRGKRKIDIDRTKIKIRTPGF